MNLDIDPEQLRDVLDALAPEKRQELEKLSVVATKERRFLPNPGSQHVAFYSEADELFYGGAAGPGKSALLVGLAVEAHQRSIIFRREFSQIENLLDEVTRVIGTSDGYSGQKKIWRLPDGNQLEFGSCPNENDKRKYRGRPHDLKCFDEITEFTETQYRFLIGWMRSTDPNQRCRVVCAGNPPDTVEGRWVIDYWGPWLDDDHPNPALPGELRWYTTINGEDHEVPDGSPIEIDGKMIKPKSRTFIPGRLRDNPDLMQTGYENTLAAMPEPYRSQLLDGTFNVGGADQPFQVIPTSWVEAAQKRWTPDRPVGVNMWSIGLDVSRGGIDLTVFSPRYGTWFGEQLEIPGIDVQDGGALAGTVVTYIRDGAAVNIDMGGGWGSSVYDHLKANGVNVNGVVGSKATSSRSRDGLLEFSNVRSELWWRGREALDPVNGDNIALPPSKELRIELCLPTFRLGPTGVKVERKEDVVMRLGRSPDRADSWLLALAKGEDHATTRAAGSGRRPVAPKVGYAARKQFLRRRRR